MNRISVPFAQKDPIQREGGILVSCFNSIESDGSTLIQDCVEEQLY